MLLSLTSAARPGHASPARGTHTKQSIETSHGVDQDGIWGQVGGGLPGQRADRRGWDDRTLHAADT